MAMTLYNSAVISIIIYSQLIFINCDDDLTSDLKNVLNEPGDPIYMRKFAEVSLITVDGCEDWFIWEYYHLGLDMSALAHYENSSLATAVCPDGGFILNWDEEDLGAAAGKNTCASPAPNPNKEGCPHCICIWTDRWNGGTPFYVKIFSLLPQESDSTNNKVVTGFKFVLNNGFTIQLQIQHATLLPSGRIENDHSFQSFTEFDKQDDGNISPGNMTEDTHYKTFSRDIRTLFLDEIFVPHGYVVTGVKFADIEENPKYKGVKMMVKGTRYDLNYKLDHSTDQWFDYRNGTREDTAYNGDRTKLDLPRCKSTVLDLFVMRSTNHYVQLKETSVHDDDKILGVHPRFEITLSENSGNLPLRGLGLSLKRATDCSTGFITKTFAYESHVYLTT